MKSKTIELTLSGELYEDLARISESTGAALSILIDSGIQRIVEPFRDPASGRVNLRPAFFSAEEGKEEHYCLVIGEKEFFKEKYYQIWIPEHDRFQSISAEWIRMVWEDTEPDL